MRSVGQGAVGAPSVVEEMLRRVSAAAAVFESRWTLRALRRVDGELCAAVEDQLSLFHEALVCGDEAAVSEHGSAMCRGWAAAVRACEGAPGGPEPDDAYMLGQSGGCIVAVGAQRAAEARVRELHGDRVIWLCPDEVAALVAGLQCVGAVARVKALWPGAEVISLIERYPDEPGAIQGDATATAAPTRG